MAAYRSSRWWNVIDLLLSTIGRGMVLLLPTVLMGIAALRTWDQEPWMLVGGLIFQALICFVIFFSYRSWDQPVGPSIVTLYLTAVAWLWFSDKSSDWFTHLCEGVLIGIPILVFGYQTLIESGAPVM